MVRTDQQVGLNACRKAVGRRALINKPGGRARLELHSIETINDAN